MYYRIPERIRRQKDPVRFQPVAEQVFCLRESVSVTGGASEDKVPGYECVRIIEGKKKTSKSSYKVFTTFNTIYDPIVHRRQPPLMKKITEALIRRRIKIEEERDTEKI